MKSGHDLVEFANKHLDEKYHLGVIVPKDNSEWEGPWDCAEFASWIAYQLTGLVVGCTNNSANPALADAYSGSWAKDAKHSPRKISIGQAKFISGSVLIRKPASSGIGHVAISQGDGTTIEAHSNVRGVTNDKVDGRRWDLAMLVPLIEYPVEISNTVYTPPSSVIVRLTCPPMQGAHIKKIQCALRGKGFNPGTMDGIFGPHTEAAARAFQISSGLAPDGEIGPITLEALGL